MIKINLISASRRGDRPFVFSNMKTGQGLEDIIAFIVDYGMLEVHHVKG